MKVESIAVHGNTMLKEREPVDRSEFDRQKAQDSAPSSNEGSKIQPEEVLNKIKELTQDGAYSVRFEMDDMTQKLIIRLVDPATGDEIRQIPPEEILGNVKHLQALRGNLVDAAS